MFASPYAPQKPAHELKAGARVVFFDETYKITAYGVPSPGLIKLYVEPEPLPDGTLPFNPLLTTVVHRDCPIQIAE